MKACPFCAEDIQDAAIVCKHCRCNLSSMPTVPTKRRPRAWIIAAGVIGTLSLGVLYIWGTSAYSADLPRAFDLVSAVEKDGVIKNRQCKPNRTVFVRSAWLRLPSEQTRRGVMLALARICIANDGGPTMSLVDPDTGATFAMFNGWDIER